MNDHDVDRALREAGQRLRAAAPDAGATENALDRAGDRGGGGTPRRWWIAPAVLATAAAAVLAVVLVTRQDETVRQVPADTVAPLPATTVPATPAPSVATTVPATTIAPTTIAPTTAPTTVPVTTLPPALPAFPTDIPLDASAAIVGCPGAFGDLDAAVPTQMGTIVGVACRDDFAVVATAAPNTDGSSYELMWNGSSWTELANGTSSPCPSTDTPVCAAFGDPPELYYMSRPIPPAWMVTDPRYLPAVDATDDVGGLGVVATGDADAFAATLAEALAAITPGDPIPRTEWEVVDTNTVVVTLRGIPDDSSSRTTYVVRFIDLDGTLTPVDALRFTYCDRGVTTDGLCL